MKTRLRSRSSVSRLRDQVDNLARLSPPRLARSLDQLGSKTFTSYSLYGEDAVINGFMRRLAFEGTVFRNLSYVEIGAWRPVQGSNTYWLYRQGIRGTLVEPNVHLATILESARPGDHVLAQACAATPTVDFFSFGSHAESNTTSANFARDITAAQGHHVKQITTVPAITLEEILSIHEMRYGDLFLLSVDAEGASEAITTSIDWDRVAVRPKILITEVDRLNLREALLPEHHPLRQFLLEYRYQLLATCGVSVIFIDQDLSIGVARGSV